MYFSSRWWWYCQERRHYFDGRMLAARRARDDLFLLFTVSPQHFAWLPQHKLRPVRATGVFIIKHFKSYAALAGVRRGLDVAAHADIYGYASPRRRYIITIFHALFYYIYCYWYFKAPLPLMYGATPTPLVTSFHREPLAFSFSLSKRIAKFSIITMLDGAESGVTL